MRIVSAYSQADVLLRVVSRVEETIKNLVVLTFWEWTLCTKASRVVPWSAWRGHVTRRTMTDRRHPCFLHNPKYCYGDPGYAGIVEKS